MMLKALLLLTAETLEEPANHAFFVAEERLLDVSEMSEIAHHLLIITAALVRVKLAVSGNNTKGCVKGFSKPLDAVVLITKTRAMLFGLNINWN
ncbi:hypothetical protein [Endozoicomonas sp.]|uniref:hypothetical protein n=1 Tax=Endozoicomonas sp. TaxID=1892382 RepID=UPI00383A0679